MSFTERSWFRAGCIALTAAATLATSQEPVDGDEASSGWSHAEKSSDEVQSLEPGASAERTFHVEATLPPAAGVEVSAISAPSGTLEVGIADSRSTSCAVSALFGGANGGWSRADTGQNAASSVIQLAEACAAAVQGGTVPGKIADVTMTITNHSSTALSFTWHLTATIRGKEAKEPAGEFVHVTEK